MIVNETFFVCSLLGVDNCAKEVDGMKIDPLDINNAEIDVYVN